MQHGTAWDLGLAARSETNREPTILFEAALDMRKTCVHAYDMSRMIQLRNVPEGLHRTLKARAALAGMSLSDYLLAEIRRVAERPTLAELRERLDRRTRVSSPVSAAQAVREERQAR